MTWADNHAEDEHGRKYEVYRCADSAVEVLFPFRLSISLHGHVVSRADAATEQEARELAETYSFAMSRPSVAREK